MASEQVSNAVEAMIAAAVRVERSVVGMCLVNPKNLGEALARGLKVDDFLHDFHRRVFGAMVDADQENRPFDLPALATMLPGQSVELVELTESASVSQNVVHYADEVMALSEQRSIERAMRDAYRALVARKPFQPIGELVDAARGAFDKTAGAARSGPKKMDTVVSSLMKKIEERADDIAKGVTRYIPTGIKALDYCLGGGFYPGRVYVPAGRPGTGKTALANFFVRTAAEAGKSALYFTLEMLAEELGERALSAESRVNGRKISTAEFGDDEVDRILHGAAMLHKLPIWYDDEFRGDVKAMIATARRQKRQQKCDLIVIDYLQLLSMGGKQDRVRELSEITMKVKLMAIELQVPVLMMSAINRGATKMADEHGPGLEHLKDSGSIEQDADSVIILHRKDDDDGTVWMNVAKNRQGPLKMFPVEVDLTIGCFRDLNLNMG